MFMYMRLVSASARNICRHVASFSCWLHSEKENKVRAKYHGLETYFPEVVHHLSVRALLQQRR